MAEVLHGGDGVHGVLRGGEGAEGEVPGAAAEGDVPGAAAEGGVPAAEAGTTVPTASSLVRWPRERSLVLQPREGCRLLGPGTEVPAASSTVLGRCFTVMAVYRKGPRVEVKPQVDWKGPQVPENTMFFLSWLTALRSGVLVASM
jgi:hypothetical protein